VEARRLTGYDSKLAGAAVIIHEVDTTEEFCHVIDTDLNGNTADAGAMWVVGETFEDVTNKYGSRRFSHCNRLQVSIANGSYQLHQI